MKQKNVILMVVAVGCGLVAAFLTAQMSGKAPEQVEVIVAAKDLAVGTTLTRDGLKDMIKTKKVSKDALPPTIVTDPEILVGKRLARPVREGETFNPQDLSTGGITLPAGYDLMSLPIGVTQGASGFVGPGSRVDVIASLRLGNTLKVFKLLVNQLVISVNHETTYEKNAAFANMSMVGFAVTDKDATLLQLAQARGCTLALKLRNQDKPADSDKDYRADDVLKLLQDPANPLDVTGAGSKEGPDVGADPKKTAPAGEPVAAPAPAPATVKVLVATRAITPNTVITNDLIAEAFEWRDLPKEFAKDAVTDFSDVQGKAFKTGVAPGQWVTGHMIGLEAPKPAPQDQFQIPKLPEPEPVQPMPPTQPVPPMPTDPKVEPKPMDPNPPAIVKPVKQKTHDVAIHTAGGTIIHRFAEVSPGSGKWKKIAELTPEQAADTGRSEKASPENRRGE
jgi:Flp pilus assembly protein CpaB